MHEEHQLNILHKMSEIVSQMTFTNKKGKHVKMPFQAGMNSKVKVLNIC